MTVVAFIPSDLDAIAQRANAAHRLARDAAARAVEHAIESGRALIEAKSAVGHGNWGAWLADYFEGSERLAQLYCRLARQVPKLTDETRNAVADLSLREAVKAVSSTNMLSIMGSSASPEWYSPPHIVDLAVEVLGEIDLDPSWHPDSPVRAHATYTAETDGLAQPWHGRVYLNPPYGRPIDAWIAKLVDDYAAGTVTEAITLLPARTDTRWFRRLEPFPRCFVYGRPIFANASGPAPFPSAIVYLGPNVERFYRSFASLGGIFVSVSYAPRGEVA